MTRKRRQAWSDFWNDSRNISRHYFVFSSFSFFGVTGSARIRQLKISRHFIFVFFLFSFLTWLGLFRKDGWIFLVTIFSSFSSFLFGRYWVCLGRTAENFSSLFFCFFLFFLSWRDWVCSDIREPKYFSSLFCFSSFFSFLFIYYTTRRIVVKSDKKIMTGWVWFREWVKTFLVTILFLFFFFFFFSLYPLHYAQDSCKIVTWNYKQAGFVFQTAHLQTFLVTILFFSSFFFDQL